MLDYNFFLLFSIYILACWYIYTILWSICSCVATKVLISKYLATRVVVSGGWDNGLDRRVPAGLLQLS